MDSDYITNASTNWVCSVVRHTAAGYKTSTPWDALEKSKEQDWWWGLDDCLSGSSSKQSWSGRVEGKTTEKHWTAKTVYAFESPGKLAKIMHSWYRSLDILIVGLRIYLQTNHEWCHWSVYWGSLSWCGSSTGYECESTPWPFLILHNQTHSTFW